jgi:hypothetical protein
MRGGLAMAKLAGGLAGGDSCCQQHDHAEQMGDPRPPDGEASQALPLNDAVRVHFFCSCF